MNRQYSDQKALSAWSDREVAERWLCLFPGRLNNPKFTKLTLYSIGS